MRIGKIQNLREINVGTTQNNYFLQKKAAHFSIEQFIYLSLNTTTSHWNIKSFDITYNYQTKIR